MAQAEEEATPTSHDDKGKQEGSVRENDSSLEAKEDHSASIRRRHIGRTAGGGEQRGLPPPPEQEDGGNKMIMIGEPEVCMVY